MDSMARDSSAVVWGFIALAIGWKLGAVVTDIAYAYYARHVRRS